MLVLHRRHLWLPCCCYSDLGFPPNLNNAAQDSTFLGADPCSHAHHPRSNLRRIPRRAPPRIRIRTVGRDWGGDYDRLEGAPEWRPSHCGGALGPSATSSPAAAVRKLDSGGCEPVKARTMADLRERISPPLKSAHTYTKTKVGPFIHFIGHWEAQCLSASNWFSRPCISLGPSSFLAPYPPHAYESCTDA